MKRLALIIYPNTINSENRDKAMFAAGVLVSTKVKFLDYVLWSLDQKPIYMVSMEKDDFEKIKKDCSMIKILMESKPYLVRDEVIVFLPKKISVVSDIMKFVGKELMLKNENKKNRNKKRKNIQRSNKSGLVQ